MTAFDRFAARFAGFTETFEDVVWSTPLFFLLLGTGLVFTVATRFVQWRVLTHGIACIRGKFDRPEDTGHINHFQALSAALSATIGLGNIAGVALAVQLGGPGAVFWMWVVGLFGMALKFAECSLSVMFRDVRDVPDPGAPALTEADAEERTLEYAGEPPPGPGAVPRARGEVRGGPMWYVWKGLAERLRARGNPLWMLFAVLAVVYALVVAVASFGGGNMFQGWNVGNILHENFGVPNTISASVISFAVALVIIGGIRRIGHVAARLVPFMCILYVGGSLVVIVMHADEVPRLLGMIFKHAFTPLAGGGAFVGVSAWAAFGLGMKRALFSNEAGQGSAAIAHAAARTEEPVREGVVAGIGPFVDTIVICTMTALVILISGVWNRPPIGHVAATDGSLIEVTVRTDQMPQEDGEAYLAELFDGQRLAIHIERRHGREPVAQEGRIVGLNASKPERYGDLTSIALTLDGLEASERAEVHRVAPGQPVFLAIEGADMTRFAFDTILRGFGRYIVTIAVCLFAFSTMISWSYYGEKGTEFLFGPRAVLPYKFMFVIAVFLGTVLPKFSTVYDFSDALAGLTVFCNLPAVLVLGPTLVMAARWYFRRLDAGQMQRTR